MLDIPGPGLAPDLDDDPRRDVPQLDPDYGGEVVHLVQVGIVVTWEQCGPSRCRGLFRGVATVSLMPRWFFMA